MKYYLFFIFLAFTSITWSQGVEKTIILKDIDTNLPIEDASVLVVKTKQTLLSNSEGVIVFELKGGSNIIITHTSYIDVTVRSATLKDQENVVYLKNNLNGLDEIIITKKHPQKILQALVKNSISNLTAPCKLKIYCREFFKLNGKNSYYNDGLMNFQIFDKSKDFKSNILVEQNRSYGLIEEEVNDDLLGYNLNNIMENYYNFKYLDLILENDAIKKYDFVIKVFSANKDLYIMEIAPLTESKGLLDNVNVIYNPEKKLIIEVNSFVSPMTFSKNKEKTNKGSKNIYKSNFKTIYRVDGADYYLLSSKEEIGFERIEKNETKEIEVKNYFVTTNFSTQNFSFKESDVFKDKTLFNKKNKILTDYWNDSGLTPTGEEKAIIDSIEGLE